MQKYKEIILKLIPTGRYKTKEKILKLIPTDRCKNIRKKSSKPYNVRTYKK